MSNNLRSRTVTHGVERTPNRAMLRAVGFGDEARAELVGHRRGEDEAARLDADDGVDLLPLELGGERVDDPAEALGVLQERRDVVEVDARLREVRHLADE